MADTKARIIIEGRDQLSARLKKVEASLKGLEGKLAKTKKTTDNVNKSFQKTANVTGQLDKGLKRLGVTLAAVFGVRALRDLTRYGGRLSDITAQSNDLLRVWGRTSSTVLPELRRATRGLVTDTELLAAQNKLLLQGLVEVAGSYDIVGEVFAAAEVRARQSGNSITAEIERIISSAKSFESEAFKELGFFGALPAGIDQRIKLYRQLLRDFAEQTGFSDTNADRLDRLITRLQNFRDILGQALADNPAFGRFLDKLNEVFSEEGVRKWAGAIIDGIQRAVNFIKANPVLSAVAAIQLTSGGRSATRAAASAAAGAAGSLVGPAATGLFAGIGARGLPRFSIPTNGTVFPAVFGRGKLRELLGQKELDKRLLTGGLKAVQTSFLGEDEAATAKRLLDQQRIERAYKRNAREIEFLQKKLRNPFKVGGKALGGLSKSGALKAVGGLGKVLGRIFVVLSIIEAITSILRGFFSSFEGGFGEFRDRLKILWTYLKGAFAGEEGGIVGSIFKTLGFIGQIIGKIFDAIDYIFRKIGEALGWLFKKMTDNMEESDAYVRRAQEDRENDRRRRIEEEAKASIEAEMRDASAATQQVIAKRQEAKKKAEEEQARRDAIRTSIREDALNTLANSRFVGRGQSRFFEDIAPRVNSVGKTLDQRLREAGALKEDPVATTDPYAVEKISTQFTLLGDALNGLIDTLVSETPKLKDFGKALAGATVSQGKSLLNQGLGSLTANLSKTASIGLGIGGILLGGILGRIFGDDKDKEKAQRNLEKIARNTDRLGDIQRLLGAPSEFALATVGTASYSGISRRTYDDLSR